MRSRSVGRSGKPANDIRTGRTVEAVIVSAAFDGKNKVQQHQIVYHALGDRMREEIHALSMQTYAPEDWQKAPH